MWGEKDGARQATVDNVLRRMYIACWVTKATDIFSKYVILIFHDYICYKNAPQCYMIITLPVLLILNFSLHSYPADTNVKDGRKSVNLILDYIY
jgi:hypothetical protein